MAEETKTIEKLTIAAKGALLEAITSAADGERRAALLETLAQAYAAVASNGPLKGELAE
ncbi:hypothetical protein [Arthrobacter sp. B10-11]|uniref:hypothetical protein n=1 Tax=Arthrobacter sp. B10-11 TaxID=3081160 RepID=UPI0029541D5A|nr:hypothetical protein [Arthrobacter sp. B10-11]MDV8148546.1 hypothetical protein [Arthrobacter sp. B10-11]